MNLLLKSTFFNNYLLHTPDVLYIKIFYFYNTASKIIAPSPSATVLEPTESRHLGFWPSTGLSLQKWSTASTAVNCKIHPILIFML